MDYKVSIICSCYKGEKYLPLFLEAYKNQTIFSDCELVLVHNDPTEGELQIIEKFKTKYPHQINHIIVPRESISISMNRAILSSHSEILINRDIDDIRTTDSLELQYNILSQNTNIYCTYGDFIVVSLFGIYEGKYVNSIDFDRNEFIKSMHCGPFRAWKKIVHDKVGYFDEQLKSSADYDLMIRIAYHYNMKKTIGNLGFYLNANLGLSTGANKFISLQEREGRLLYERYRIYSKIDYFIGIDSNTYDVNSIVNGGKKIDLNLVIPRITNHKSFESIVSSLRFTIIQGCARIAKYFYLYYVRYYA